MRSLFRDSEARAARLRLLIRVSRSLAAAGDGQLDAALADAAREAARFAGYADGAIRSASDPRRPAATVIPFDALASQGEPGRGLELWSPQNTDALATEDDAEALRLLAEMIEARLTVDLHQRSRKILLERLAHREKQLEQVLSGVVSAQERERSAISADLHDGVAQQISAVHRRLELLQLDLPPDCDPRSQAEVQTLIEIARCSVADLRRLIAGLRPTSLDDFGVVPALHEDARRLEAMGHKVTVHDGGIQRLPEWQETLIFRVSQEALNNVAKHAPGSTVDISVMVDQPSGQFVLTVRNTGGEARMQAVDGSPRFGLEIMRERLAAVAGQLDAGPVAGGFQIRAWIPLAGV